MLDEDAESEDEESAPGELQFTPTFTRRSKGTVQHATFEWKSHKEHYSSGHYTLAVVATNAGKERSRMSHWQLWFV